MKNQSLPDIAENWYARLNRLKYLYATGDLSPEKKEQLLKLIGIMIGRIMKLWPHYSAMMQARFKPNTSFQPGGVIFND